MSTANLAFIAGKTDWIATTIPLMRDITSQAPAAICEVTPGGISRNLLSDFFFKTAGRRYKPLFPECDTYLQRTREFVASSRALYDKVHNGRPLTRPPRTGL